MSGPKSYDYDYVDPQELARMALQNRLNEISRNEKNIFDKYEKSSAVFRKIQDKINRICNTDTKESSPNIIKNVQDMIKNRTIMLGGSAKIEAEDITNDDNNSDGLQKIKDNFNTALEEYISACVLAEKDIPDCFEFDENRAEEFTSFLIAERKRILDEMTDEYSKREAYKASVLTLEEMGYSVVGSKNSCNSRGNSIRSTLVKVSDNVGINMICIGGEKYTFEVVGITDDGHTVTDAERQTLTKTMSEMCISDFKTFLDKMEKRGFRAVNVDDRPPKPNYCKNKCVLDYNDKAYVAYKNNEFKDSNIMTIGGKTNG